MNSELEDWIEKEGQVFLRSIGLKSGQTVLDFGCGEGYYSIPASKLVGMNGKVYAMDKNGSALNKLKRYIEANNMKNIELIKGENNVSLENNSMDMVLCYDVLHYMEPQDRKKVYSEIWKVLKEGAIFSVYPKHNKEDSPSGELAKVNIKGLIEEINDSGFSLIRKISKNLLHDERINKGSIVNFTKGVKV